MSARQSTARGRRAGEWRRPPPGPGRPSAGFPPALTSGQVHPVRAGHGLPVREQPAPLLLILLVLPPFLVAQPVQVFQRDARHRPPPCSGRERPPPPPRPSPRCHRRRRHRSPPPSPACGPPPPHGAPGVTGRVVALFHKITYSSRGEPGTRRGCAPPRPLPRPRVGDAGRCRGRPRAPGDRGRCGGPGGGGARRYSRCGPVSRCWAAAPCPPGPRSRPRLAQAGSARAGCGSQTS